MNIANLIILVLTFLAPAAAMAVFAAQGGYKPGVERKGLLMLFGFSALIAIAGIARIDQAIKMEMILPLTLEPSGYFEFALQSHWTRYVWILFTSAMLLGFVAFDTPRVLEGGRLGLRMLFLCGSYLSSVIAFLSDNILLSLMFAEIAAFLLHAFGMEAGGEIGELERGSYLKRGSFIFLGLVVLFGLAMSRLLTTGSVVVLGAVLYIFAGVASRYNPRDWSRIPLILVELGMGLFLLERVLLGESASAELWAPLTAIFALATVALSLLSLLSAGVLGAAFWLGLSFLGYLLFLRFGSSRPGDPFWGVYEAVGLGSVFAISILFRFGERLELFWKKALGFVILVLFLGIISGALPSVEVAAARFDSETSMFKIAALGVLTFFVAAVAGKALVQSFPKAGTRVTAGLFAVIAPSLFVLAAQGGGVLRWSELNFEGIALDGFFSMVYELRVLIAASGVGLGILAGSLWGANARRRTQPSGRDLRMEDLFPGMDLSLIKWNQALIRLPEAGIERAFLWIRGCGTRGARFVDLVDQNLFGARLFRGVSEAGTALSMLARGIHNGQVRMYLFLGILFSLISSFFFLLEGR